MLYLEGKRRRLEGAKLAQLNRKNLGLWALFGSL
jgi:hypothetical protein